MAIVRGMDLSEYIANTDRRKALATELAGPERAATMSMYLWQIATGWRGRRPSLNLALRIESATDRAVSVADLRPDIASAIGHMPEQIRKEAA